MALVRRRFEACGANRTGYRAVQSSGSMRTRCTVQRDGARGPGAGQSADFRNDWGGKGYAGAGGRSEWCYDRASGAIVMANPKYAATDQPAPVCELVDTLSDGTKVKRRLPRMRAC